jgi:hypothetical protein
VGLVRVNSAPKVIDVADVKRVKRSNDMLDSIAEKESEDLVSNNMMKFNNK